MERPLAYRNRTGHQLPQLTQLQKTVHEIDIFCKAQQMIINQKKTKTAVFNSAVSRDFYPQITNLQGETYDNVEEFKLLGVEFASHPRSGIKWDNFIQKSIKLAFSKMWILRRLAESGVLIDDLLMVFMSRVRIHLEQHVPLWHFSITKSLSDKIERVQKMCLYIILGGLATPDYYLNSTMLNLEPLSERRDKICRKFSAKTFKHPTHRNMFAINQGKSTSFKRKVEVPITKTARYAKSAVPNLAKIINSL